jgi:hypothetical protein
MRLGLLMAFVCAVVLAQSPRTELMGFAVLPADTFSAGPASGQFTGTGGMLDANTLLVANDNNYDAMGGRGKDVKDPNEFIWLKLANPLRLAPGVGLAR